MNSSTIRLSIPYPRIPSSRSATLPSRKSASVGTTSTAYSSQSGFASSSRYTAAKRQGREAASFSNSALNRRLKGHHVAQNMTTVGLVACTTVSWKATGSRTCNIVRAFTSSEDDKASHVEFHGSAFARTQRHIRGPPDTRPSFVHRRDGMGSPVVSEEVRLYFQGLASQVEATYAVARAARAGGFDAELDVEIPLTDDLASRVERLLEHYEVEGVARRIRELAKIHDREELAILVAPLEGLATVKIKRNKDGSSYVDLSYAGPIRSAGGTGQALSVLIADVV